MNSLYGVMFCSDTWADIVEGLWETRQDLAEMLLDELAYCMPYHPQHSAIRAKTCGNCTYRDTCTLRIVPPSCTDWEAYQSGYKDTF